jgi:hypothetical protein
METNGVLTCGLVFPEFKRAADWVQRRWRCSSARCRNRSTRMARSWNIPPATTTCACATLRWRSISSIGPPPRRRACRRLPRAAGGHVGARAVHAAPGWAVPHAQRRRQPQPWPPTCWWRVKSTAGRFRLRGHQRPARHAAGRYQPPLPVGTAGRAALGLGR